MAFVSTNSNIRVSILGFIKHLVSKSLYRAIEILLKPCCDINILDVESSCNGTNYDITITLDKSVNMLGNGLMLVLVDQVLVSGDNGVLLSYNDSTKIVLTNVTLNISAGNYKVGVFFLLPTGATHPIQSLNDLTPGVFTLATSDATWNFPGPCLT